MSGSGKNDAIDLCDDEDDDVVIVESKKPKKDAEVVFVKRQQQQQQQGPKKKEAGPMLMEGEAEALRRGEARSWEVRPSRNFDPSDVGDSHFRRCESQFKRQLGSAANQYALKEVRYVCNPALVRRFEEKAREYDRRFGAKQHTQLLAFHGTSKANVESILRQGFRMDKVGSTTDPGYFGAGIYFSEIAATSIHYAQGSNQLLLCRVLLGKPFRLSSVQTGRGLQPGYTSHVTDAQGTEVVIFHEAAMLPVYVLSFAAQHNARLPGSVLVPGDTSLGQNAAGVPVLPLAGDAAADDHGAALAGAGGKRRSSAGRLQNSARAGRGDTSNAAKALRGLFRAVKKPKHSS